MPLPPPRRPTPERPSEPEAEGAPSPCGPDRPPVRPTSKWTGSTVLQIVFIVIVLIAALGYMLWEGDKLPNDPGEIDRIRVAARLNPFPKEAQGIQLVPPEEAADTNYAVTFNAPDYVVESWLSNSPGAKAVKAEYVSGNYFRYPLILATGKLSGAEVRWKRTDHLVWISLPLGRLKTYEPENLQGKE